MKGFLAELGRRNVYKVAGVYVVASWVIMQVADVMFPAFALPGWTITLVALLLLLGLPIALVLAWAFELTPAGLVRADNSSESRGKSRQGGPVFVVALLVIVTAAAILAFNRVSLLAPVIRGDAPPDLRSIAVLPFQNVSGDPVNEPFTVGIHDDLLTSISKIGSIRTISRTSVIQYRDTSKSASEIGRELGVATLLEGGVQRIGDRVRINVQLINSRNDAALWGRSYDRELSAANIFSIQSEIARDVARSLHTELTERDNRRLDSLPTDDLAAYEAFILGNQRLQRRTVRDLETAAQYFEEATRHDPEYALAWVGLANSYALRWQYGGLAHDVIERRAAEALERAFEIDSELAEAYAARGLLHFLFDRNEAGAENLERAIELDPNYAQAYHWYAELLKTDLGRPDLAAGYFDRALELDPLSAVINAAAGTNMHMLGRFEEAFAHNARSIEIDAAIPGAYWGDATLEWAVRGDLVRATGILNRMRRLDPRSPQYASLLALLNLDLGDTQTATRVAEEAMSLGSDDFAANQARLWVAAYLGDARVADHTARSIVSANPGGDLYANSASTLHALGIAEVDDARRLLLYQQFFPELFSESALDVGRSNYRAAIDLAGILVTSGQVSHASWLLAESSDAVAMMPRLGWFGYGVADAEILALRGDGAAAIAALQAAYEEGWRLRWWTLRRNPNLSAVRDAPEIATLSESIEAEMAAQLAEIRNQRDLGVASIAPAPASPAAAPSLR